MRTLVGFRPKVSTLNCLITSIHATTRLLPPSFKTVVVIGVYLFGCVVVLFVLLVVFFYFDLSKSKFYLITSSFATFLKHKK